MKRMKVLGTRNEQRGHRQATGQKEAEGGGEKKKAGGKGFLGCAWHRQKRDERGASQEELKKKKTTSPVKGQPAREMKVLAGPEAKAFRMNREMSQRGEKSNHAFHVHLKKKKKPGGVLTGRRSRADC